MKRDGMGIKEGMIVYLELLDRHLIIVLKRDKQSVDFGHILRELDEHGNLTK